MSEGVGREAVPTLILVTDPAYGDDAIARAVEACGEALPSGAFCVQLRDKKRHKQQLVAAGYLDYDSVSGRFSISNEHAAVLADESRPVFFPGAFEVAAAAWAALDKTTQNFRTGDGIA